MIQKLVNGTVHDTSGPNRATYPSGNGRNGANRASSAPKAVRCAVYTRKSTEEGLDQEFNTLDAQRAACEAFIASQKGEGWILLPDHFDDGGFTGANIE